MISVFPEIENVILSHIITFVFIELFKGTHVGISVDV